ncbi:MAG: HAD family hydrolase [Gammaproteobacteria bacterium]
MRFKKIKVLTFDLDDTLWECMPVIEKAENKLRKWLNNNYPEITSKYSIADFNEYRNTISKQYSDSSHDFTFIRKKLLYNCAINSGYSQKIATDVLNLGFELFITERSNVELYDDVIPSFKILSNNFRLGALTNGNVDIAKTSLLPYFDFFLNSITAGYPKPDTRFFQHACNLAEVDASEIVHIGDHPVHDIQGAAESGITSIWLNRNKSEWPDLPKPDNTIISLKELPDLLIT